MKKLIPVLLSLWAFTLQAQQLVKGPYLIYPGNPDEMSILWQTDASATCTLSWGTAPGQYDFSQTVQEYGSDHQFKYTLTGLNPGQHYFYRVQAGSQEKTGDFLAAPSAGSSTDLTFYVYGDTRSHPEVQNQVTGRILTEIANDPASQSFCLVTGDCVTKGRVESYWQNQFFNTSYPNNETLKSKMPFFLARGNHENYDGSYNSGYATVFYKYWPYVFASGSTNGDDMYYSFDYGPVHIAVLDQYDNGTWHPGRISNAQRQWLENDLASSDKPWKFVMFHEPGWSARSSSRSEMSEHSNNTDIQQNIQPILVQNGVKAVFAGHNHYYAHTLVDSIHHFTLGGGGAPLYAPSYTSGGIVVYAEATYHFMKVSIRGNVATLSVIKPDGTLVESIQLHVPAQDVAKYVARQIRIYPNPAGDVLHIQTGEFTGAELQLTDRRGSVVLTRPIRGHQTQLDVSRLPGGLYLLHFRIHGIEVTKKLMLK